MKRAVKPSNFIGVILAASLTYGCANERFVYPDPEISIKWFRKQGLIFLHDFTQKQKTLELTFSR